MHKLPNLYKSRHGVYYIRQYTDGGEVRRSTGTKDFRTAKILILHFLMAKEMAIKKFDLILPGGVEVRNINSKQDIDLLLELTGADPLQDLLKAASTRLKASPPNPPGGTLEKGCFVPQDGTPKLKTKLFSVATELYLAEKAHDNSNKTIAEKRSAYKEFINLFGDVDTNSITPDTAISYKNQLLSGGLSALRINKTLSFLKDFFAYAINHKLYFSSNPFDNLAISRKSKLHKGVRSYEEFTDEELKLIFENPEYRIFMNKPDYYWLPFLALFTGARIEELASLKISQICTENGVVIFKIEDGKNSNSIRKIPLHSMILGSKFLEYIDQVKDKNGQIFPELKPGKNGFSKNCSRRFGQYLEKIGIKNDRKVFHSFRSTFINRMTYANIHPAILMAIVGHYSQQKLDFSSPHFKTYQQNKPVQILKTSIEELKYDLKLEF